MLLIIIIINCGTYNNNNMSLFLHKTHIQYLQATIYTYIHTYRVPINNILTYAPYARPLHASKYYTPPTLPPIILYILCINDWIKRICHENIILYCRYYFKFSCIFVNNKHYIIGYISTPDYKFHSINLTRLYDKTTNHKKSFY